MGRSCQARPNGGLLGHWFTAAERPWAPLTYFNMPNPRRCAGHLEGPPPVSSAAAGGAAGSACGARGVQMRALGPNTRSYASDFAPVRSSIETDVKCLSRASEGLVSGAVGRRSPNVRIRFYVRWLNTTLCRTADTTLDYCALNEHRDTYPIAPSCPREARRVGFVRRGSDRGGRCLVCTSKIGRKCRHPRRVGVVFHSGVIRDVL